MITPIIQFTISEADAVRAKKLGFGRIAPGIRVALQRRPVQTPPVVDNSPARAVRIRWTPADLALAQRWANELNLPDARGAAVQTALRAALPEAEDAARADAVHDQRLEVYRAVADDLQARFRVPARAAEDAAWAMLQKGWLAGELPKKDPRGE